MGRRRTVAALRPAVSKTDSRGAACRRNVASAQRAHVAGTLVADVTRLTRIVDIDSSSCTIVSTFYAKHKSRVFIVRFCVLRNGNHRDGLLARIIRKYARHDRSKTERRTYWWGGDEPRIGDRARTRMCFFIIRTGTVRYAISERENTEKIPNNNYSINPCQRRQPKVDRGLIKSVLDCNQPNVFASYRFDFLRSVYSSTV